MAEFNWGDYFAAQVSQISFPVLDITGNFYRDSLILANDIDRLALNIKSFREPLKRSVKEVIIPSIIKNFESEGRPQWAPLADATVRIRGASGPILRRTNRLFKVATQLNIWTIDRDSAAVTGIDGKVKYARFHQGGTSVMPQREFIKYQHDDEIAIEAVFYEWLVERSVRMGRFRP